MSEQNLKNSSNCDYKIEEVDEIQKDLKKLMDIPNFESAYDVFKKALPQIVCERDFYRTSGVYRISGLSCDCEAYIIKKIFCKGIGKDRFRATYIVRKGEIKLIEIYSKDHKKIEDKIRVCKYCG